VGGSVAASGALRQRIDVQPGLRAAEEVGSRFGSEGAGRGRREERCKEDLRSRRRSRGGLAGGTWGRCGDR